MVKATRLDRLIAAVSPSTGLRRLQARTKFEFLAGAYKGGSRSRDALSGWVTRAGSADSDTLDDLPTLRNRSRDLIRNNPTAAGAIHTKVGSVVGTGLKLHSSIDRDFLGMSDDQADEWEATAEREFAFWGGSQNCDVRRTLFFPDHQDLAFRATLENGDHFVLLSGVDRQDFPYRLALQHIEADRVSNPSNARDTDTQIAGVDIDSSGAPIRYHVQDSHPGEVYRVKRTWSELPAFTPSGRRATLHLYRVLRAGQTRGVPDLAPVIEPLKQLDRYADAEIDAAVKNAVWAVLVQTETGEGLAGLNYGEWQETRKEYYQQAPVNLKEGSSNVVGLFPDDKFESFNPERPNSAFEPFVTAVFAQIGVGLELPLEVVTKRFQSSYSAARAALLQAQQYFNGRRAWLARYFCQPIYEALLYEAILLGRIVAPGYLQDPMIRAAYCSAEWIGDAPGHIDETKAVTAAIQRIYADLSTKKRETAALTGEDWEKVRRQREKERRLSPDSPANQPDQPSADDLDREDNR